MDNKWSTEMQIRFIENLIAGCPTTIEWYAVRSSFAMENFYLLDGLQRSTAICDFMDNKFMILGKYFYSDICSRIAFSNTRISFHFYLFDTDADACEYYIARNKGISHNEEDLKPAYAFLKRQDLA